jgi:Lrp/AsnC family leucine-responsive transcriptional regulator
MARRREVHLDRIDRQLLAHLERHGRATLPELALATRLSPSATQRRLRHLESDRVVRGYRAVLDPDVMGRSVVVFLSVALTDHAVATVEAFERAVLDLEGLVSCHHMTGEVDYLLRVDVADLDELDALLRRRLPALPGVGRITTSVATSTLVDRPNEV